MAKKYLDDNGLLYFWGKIKAAFVSDVTWDSTNKKLQRTKNGSTSDLVTFATVATSGSYTDLSDKPTTGVSDVTVDGTSVVSNGVAAISLGIGSASGICPLDSNAKVDAQYLPSYVDDVIEAYPVSGATELTSGWLSTTSGGSALTPETGKIYVLMSASTNYDANTQFRWGGTAYVKLADGGVTAITNAEIDTIVAS